VGGCRRATPEIDAKRPDETEKSKFTALSMPETGETIKNRRTPPSNSNFDCILPVEIAIGIGVEFPPLSSIPISIWMPISTPYTAR